MNGALAEPWVKTMISPIKTMIKTMGSSHNRFLTVKNCQNSFKTLNLDIDGP